MKIKLKIAIAAMIGINFGINAQEKITTENGAKSDFVYKNGSVGIGTTNPGNSRLAISSSQNTIVRSTTPSTSTFAGFQADANTTGLIQLLQFSPNRQTQTFGLSSDANWGFLYTSGASSNGLAIGTFTNKPIVIGTNNQERIRIKENGNVGIGTVQPLSKLHVFDSGTGAKGLTIHNNAEQSGNAAAVWFKNASSNSDYRKGAIMFVNDGRGHGRGDLVFALNNSASSNVAKVNDAKMTIKGETGNVGIGTTSPIDKLDLYRSSDSNEIGITLRQMFNNGNHVPQNSGISRVVQKRYNTNLGNYRGELTIQCQDYNNSYYMRDVASFLSNGNVGIGTHRPQKRFHATDNREDFVSVIENTGIGHAKNGLWLKTKSTWTSATPLKVTKGTNDEEVFQVGANQVRIGTGTINQTDALLSVKGDFTVGNGNSYNDITFKTGTNITGYTGTFQISPKTIPGSGTSQQITYFKDATNGTGKTVHNVAIDGKLGIGTTDTKGFKLGVNGKIAATEVKIALYPNWPDFVFEKAYNLPTLTEVENHIKLKGHLKDIPSAKEVEKNGFFLGNMDAKLLQKIEELTLYTIAQEKEITALKQQNAKIKKQEKEIEELKKQNKVLQSLLERVSKLEKKVK